MSNRGEDHIEMETLIKKPSIPSKPSSENPSEPDKPFSSTRPKMPAITMKWKAPEATSAATKPSLTVAKAATKKLKLELDHKAKLHPKRFESMWDEYVERFQTDLSEANRPDSDKLIPNMEAHGISCMASGTVNGMEKFVFYGKQQGHSWFFLVSVDVTVATAKTVLTVRASSDAANDLVLQLVELLKTTINESVAL
ncbi:hypothetical protein PHYBOEH_009117 [Phytophthora boehmeriae]|uniref:Beta-adaptin appendage C-terminal subdomain domain-containing protein n=1 Tax=Phytophthora boehmeriae TaxID=109152 RepID=A0A8T1X0E6_9STRA|nr:hypothetical protein PHYBOEH_009117 [Phytophthora boehmeriae]